MVLSRKIDDKEIQLKNQSLIFFQISGAGHEAVLVAAGMVAQARLRLVLSLLPRPRALPDARRDAARDAPGARRREGRSELRRPPDAVALGPQAAQHRLAVEPHRHAVPARDRLRRKRAASTRRVTAIEGREQRFHADEVVYLSIGEGTTSEGEFWESLNAACLGRLPVVYPGRRQRLRDLGPGRSADRRRRHLEARRRRSRASSSRASTAPTSSRATRAMSRRRRVRARAQGSGVRPRQGHPPVLALAVGRREAVQDGGRARGGSQARSDRRGWRRSSWPRGIATEAELEALAREVEEEVNDGRRARHRRAEKPARGHRDALRLLARRRSDVRRLRHGPPSRKASRTRWSRPSTAR